MYSAALRSTVAFESWVPLHPGTAFFSITKPPLMFSRRRCSDKICACRRDVDDVDETVIGTMPAPLLLPSGGNEYAWWPGGPVVAGRGMAWPGWAPPAWAGGGACGLSVLSSAELASHALSTSAAFLGSGSTIVDSCRLCDAAAELWAAYVS